MGCTAAAAAGSPHEGKCVKIRNFPLDPTRCGDEGMRALSLQLVSFNSRPMGCCGLTRTLVGVHDYSKVGGTPCHRSTVRGKPRGDWGKVCRRSLRQSTWYKCCGLFVVQPTRNAQQSMGRNLRYQQISGMIARAWYPLLCTLKRVAHDQRVHVPCSSNGAKLPEEVVLNAFQPRGTLQIGIILHSSCPQNFSKSCATIHD